MNKTQAAEKNGHSVTSDFIKLRPEVKFINDDDAVIVITAGGYRRLNSRWIKKLHEKISPVLLKGCSKQSLLKQVGDETRGALNLYLQALERADSFIKGNVQKKSYGNISGDSYADLLKLFSPAKTSETVIIEQTDKKQVLILCAPSRLLQVLDKLGEFEKDRQLIVFVLGKEFMPNAHFEGIMKWHLQTEPFPSRKAFRLSVFRWDDSHLSCTLKPANPSLPKFQPCSKATYLCKC